MQITPHLPFDRCLAKDSTANLNSIEVMNHMDLLCYWAAGKVYGGQQFITVIYIYTDQDLAPYTNNTIQYNTVDGLRSSMYLWVMS